MLAGIACKELTACENVLWHTLFPLFCIEQQGRQSRSQGKVGLAALTADCRGELHNSQGLCPFAFPSLTLTFWL